MTKIYSAIQGKKLSLIGEGLTLIGAINDAGLEFTDGIDTDEQKEDYVRSAHSDYVIEENLYDL